MKHPLPSNAFIRNDLRPHHAAFSIVELLMVLCIMAVLSAIAIPRYAASLARYRADATASRIAQDLEMIQSRAYSLSTTQSVIFSVSSNSYQVVGMSDPSLSSQPYIVRVSAAPYCATLQTVNFGGSNTISFDAFGQPATSGTVVISVGQEQRTVTINQSSGRASVQ